MPNAYAGSLDEAQARDAPRSGSLDPAEGRSPAAGLHRSLVAHRMPAAAAHAAGRGGPPAAICRPHDLARHSGHDSVQTAASFAPLTQVLPQAFLFPPGQSINMHAGRISARDSHRIRVRVRFIHSVCTISGASARSLPLNLALEHALLASACSSDFLCNMCSDVCSAVLSLATACPSAEAN